MGRIRHLTKSRIDALKRYYKNPNICKNCNKIINVGIDQTVQDARVKKFCSMSCSSRYNNLKRKKKVYKCPICKNDMYKKARLCRKCMIKESIDNMAKIPIGHYKNSKYTEVRRQARKYMEYLSIERRCFICGFDICVDVCHIKRVSDFEETSLIGEVNDKSNLAYLCPNHHAMLDRGLLDLIIINGVK